MTPHPEYLRGLREAAEIAREQQREHARRLHNAFVEQSPDRAMRYAYREDAVRDVAEAIEAKAGEKQPG